MKPSITFVTGNKIKFDSAQHLLKPFGIKLAQVPFDAEEIQSHDGEKIVRHKAEQAYSQLQTPLMVSDDTWIIPGLKGFPGPYMKYMNDWFTPEDFLRLTLPLEDRRIILRQHTVYHDGTQQHYFVGDVPGTLLTEVRGSSIYPHLTLTSFDDGDHSRAELIAAGKPGITAPSGTVWHAFGEWWVTQSTQ